jgi:hypothetical protein
MDTIEIYRLFAELHEKFRGIVTRKNLQLIARLLKKILWPRFK